MKKHHKTEDEQDRLHQGQMYGRGEGTDPFEGSKRGAEVLRLLS